MTHLSAEEFVDLMDGALPPARRAHLQACEACRLEAGALDAVVARTTEAAGVPEPSPLFWAHLSTRVREAVAEPEAARWRDWLWRPGTAWAAGLASVALALTVTHAVLPRATVAIPSPVPSALVATAPAAAAGESAEPGDDLESDAAWALVRSVADQIEWDEAHDAGISARPDAAERMTLELSTREQSELARLLRGALGTKSE